MITVKNNNGEIELYQGNGNFLRTIGNGNAFYVDINQDGSLILITTFNGKVELRAESGSLIRTIGDKNYLMAKFRDNNVLVTSFNHVIELRNENGELIKII